MTLFPQTTRKKSASFCVFCGQKPLHHIKRRKIAERQGQRREPAPDDVGFVSERIGWLRFAAPCLLGSFC